jgi:undecaprenyl diphosphate synthase
MRGQKKIPQHVAIIMDGNGRWANQHNLPRIEGHRRGANSTKAIIEAAQQHGIKILTLWAFSTENWQRPTKEVQFLMNLFFYKLDKEIKDMHKNNIQFRIIGDISQLSTKLQKKIAEATDITANNTGLKLIIAFNYGGYWDITQAVQKIAVQVEKKELSAADITPEHIQQNLSTADLPNPDLLIRTSGELRLSNFMMWQLAYTELYFTETLWPDFSAEELEKALQSYALRERRFGVAIQRPLSNAVKHYAIQRPLTNAVKRQL